MIEFPLIPDDFTLELYKRDGTWIKQIMVDQSYNVIEDYIGKHPLNDEYYYSIWCITYDNETGEEMVSFPMY